MDRFVVFLTSACQIRTVHAAERLPVASKAIIGFWSNDLTMGFNHQKYDLMINIRI
jgi:hypothetical protein